MLNDKITLKRSREDAFMKVFPFLRLLMFANEWKTTATLSFRDHGSGALMAMEPSSWSTVTVSEPTGSHQTTKTTVSPEFQV